MMAALAVIGLGPVEAKSKHHSSSHSSSTHHASGKSAKGGKASRKSSSSRRSSAGKSRSSRHSSSRYSRSRRGGSFRASNELPTETQPREALPRLESTAPLDPNDAAAGNGEPIVVDPMAQARDAMARGDPAEALGRYLRVLARDPGDLEALSGAGAAALAVGDADAAINFYVRAQKIAPRDGPIKAGLGSALVQKEQPRMALKLFGDAVDLGVPPVTVALDRGLAYDLRGDNKRAQQEYALVMRVGTNAEATRRMALSMAMGGDRAGALATLDPLLRKQDIPAWRARAFVLAITGDAAGAEQAAYAVLPRPQADELKPFLERLPQLKPAEKAAAVHFGHFPEDKAPQLVDVSPAASSRSAPVVTAPSSPSSPGLANAASNFALTPSPPGGRAGASPPPVYLRPDPVGQGNAIDATVAASRTRVEARQSAEEQLSNLRKIASGKGVADSKAAAEKSAADKAEKAADRKAEAAKATAEKAAEKKAKEREEAKARSSEPGRYWVQIASGAYKPDLTKELAKQKAKWGKQLAGKSAWTTPYKATNRLMIGPFTSSDAAQDYVNEVRKQGFSCFPVTTSPGQKVERLD
jgi:tetratricopeptide (TPR) repeat protein